VLSNCVGSEEDGALVVRMLFSAETASAGVTRGSRMREKDCQAEAPSISAASSNEMGMAS